MYLSIRLAKQTPVCIVGMLIFSKNNDDHTPRLKRSSYVCLGTHDREGVIVHTFFFTLSTTQKVSLPDDMQPQLTYIFNRQL